MATATSAPVLSASVAPYPAIVVVPTEGAEPVTLGAMVLGPSATARVIGRRPRP